MKRLAILLTLLMGCATPQSPAPTAEAGPRPDRKMMGLDDPVNHDFWRDWKPRSSATPVEDAVVFDHWVVDDPQAIEGIWRSLYAVLDAMRASTDETTRKSITMVMSTLEPATDGSARMYIGFVVRKNAEGLIATMSSNAGALEPAVHVHIERTAKGFNPLVLIADPAAQDHPPVRLTLQTATPEADVDGKSIENAPVLRSLLMSALWLPYTESKYVEAKTGRPTKYLGPLENRDREMDEILNPTAFPPRMDLNELVPPPAAPNEATEAKPEIQI